MRIEASLAHVSRQNTRESASHAFTRRPHLSSAAPPLAAGIHNVASASRSARCPSIAPQVPSPLFIVPRVKDAERALEETIRMRLRLPRVGRIVPLIILAAAAALLSP